MQKKFLMIVALISPLIVVSTLNVNAMEKCEEECAKVNEKEQNACDKLPPLRG